MTPILVELNTITQLVLKFIRPPTNCQQIPQPLQAIELKQSGIPQRFSSLAARTNDRCKRHNLSQNEPTAQPLGIPSEIRRFFPPRSAHKSRRLGHYA